MLLNQPCPYFDFNDDHAPFHSGSTLLAFDNDGDGDKEALIGDISYNKLTYLINGGTTTYANITSQDSLFPSYNVSCNVLIFPASFLADVNNDGLKDLLAAPNAEGGSENYKCSWYYRNDGNLITSDFNLQSDTFLVNDMIDVGEGANPVFFDVDNDGLQDLLIGSEGHFTNDYQFVTDISYYRNNGTASSPSFDLVTKDWITASQLSNSGVLNVVMTFGDLDGDGDGDMLMGTDDGYLIYYMNTAPPGDPANFIFASTNYAGIDVGTHATPQLVDVDKDGLLDLLIGERDGNINYYKNEGSLFVPNFIFQTDHFGGIDLNAQGNVYGYSMPYLLTFPPDSTYTLLVGSERGIIYQYDSIEGNLSGNFHLVDSTFMNIDVGRHSTISGANIKGDDSIELVVGNYRGGVTIYDLPIATSVADVGHNDFSVYPNPSSGIIEWEMPDYFSGKKIMLQLFNDLGMLIMQTKISTEGNHEVDLGGDSDGLYILNLTDGNRSAMREIILEK